MAFKLSSRSLAKLEGVHPDMVKVCMEAIKQTTVDFGITCGMRTLAEQKELVRTKRSQTLKSKHLEGLAVDVVAYFGSEVSWDGAVYDDIADAFAQASHDLSIPVRWGGAWQINSISHYNDNMEAATNSYVDLRRSQGKRPFFDGPHFELSAANSLAEEYQ
jgi:peptidoglycan L-alanyl-D-glutamate endopeptidase CwlK